MTIASSTSQSVFELFFGIIIGSYGPVIAELDLKKRTGSSGIFIPLSAACLA